MKFQIIFIVVITLLVGWTSADEFPASTIERCKFEDEVCLVDTWNKWMHYAIKNGVPELKIPVADKYFIEKQEISIGSNLLTIKITFHNVSVYGLAETTITSVKGFKKDPKQMTGFQITAFAPRLSVYGTYVSSGKLLLLEVSGNGPGEIQFYNTTCKVTASTKTEVRDGEEYLIITKARNEYRSDRHAFKFENILNNKEISDGINKMVNENHELFAKEANRPAAASFARVFKEVLKPLFARYPYRSFFVD